MGENTDVSVVNYEAMTTAVIVLCALVLIAWDVFVAFFNDVPNDQDTISGILLRWSLAFSGLPFAFGVLLGHLFVPARGVALWWPHAALVGALVSVGLSAVLRAGGRKYAAVIGALALLSGGVVGHLAWPQVF